MDDTRDWSDYPPGHVGPLMETNNKDDKDGKDHDKDGKDHDKDGKDHDKDGKDHDKDDKDHDKDHDKKDKDDEEDSSAPSGSAFDFWGLFGKK